MFAHVIPFLKLPRRFGVFDYRIPEGASFSVGDVVEVPFRHRRVFGVITDITPTTTESRVVDITSTAVLFHIEQQHLEHLCSIATYLGQSPSSLFSVAYEGLSTLSENHRWKSQSSSSPKIDKETVQTVKEILHAAQNHLRLSVAIDDETSVVLAHALCKATQDQVLILVPRERDARYFGNLFSACAPAVLTGKSKRYERNAIIRSWKSGSLRVLIGTRQTVLIEPHALRSILVYQSACEDHGSILRNPHINATHAAASLARIHGANLFLADVLPKPNESRFTPEKKPTDLTLIDTTHRSEQSGFPLLSYTLLEQIKLALHSEKKVLLSFNRKGVAKRLECKDCGHVPFCGTCGNLPTVRLDDLLCEACGSEMWKPETCPSCGSKKIGPRSIGGARIIDDLKKAFPGVSVGHIEKGTVELDSTILVATEYFWSSVHTPFRTYGFGLIAELLADIGFTPGDFRGSETTARKISRLQHLAQREHATCLIQTVARDRLQSLLGTAHFNDTELNIRKKYLLPPYSVIVTFEGATPSDLPETFHPMTHDRRGILTAKITPEVYDQWKPLFSQIPDHVNIRIQQ